MSQFDPQRGVIEAVELTKVFGSIRAVDDLSFICVPGRVTGFLGPNGAGKTTTLRMLLGLAKPTSGSAKIGGLDYGDQPRPASHIGAVLEAASFHPGRTARDHLRVYAPEVGASDARIREVLAMVGLQTSADRRVAGYSTGMRQRLALATALLGDPQVLLLDEPANGLDPEGIVWLREFVRHLAAEGRTVVVSSHLLAEVQQSVDDVIIIAAGRLVFASSLADLAAHARPATRLVSPDAVGLRSLATRNGWAAATNYENPNTAVISDRSPAEVGAAAFAAGLEIHELVSAGMSLEELFLSWTAAALGNGIAEVPGGGQ